MKMFQLKQAYGNGISLFKSGCKSIEGDLSPGRPLTSIDDAHYQKTCG